ASRAIFGFVLAGLATVALVVSGIAPAPPIPDKLMLFVGRFHPLIVHMPIGFLAAIAVLQVLQWVFRFEFRAANRVLLWLCALSAIASTAVGTLLVWPGDYSGEILDDHRWFGIATSAVCVWMLFAHHFPGWLGRISYAFLLFVSLGLISATGHYGGSLTHGEDYLTAYLPVALGGKPEPVPVDKGTKEDAAIYVAAIQPIIEAKCVECHNPSKSNGNLRMDALDLLLAGGKHGPSLQAGDAAASLMIQRANLPLDDEEHMPPKGKPQLTEAELELLSWWIDRGAKERQPLSEDLPPKAALALLEEKLGFPVAAPELPMLSWEEVTKVGAPLAKVPYLAVRRVAMDSPAVNVFIGAEAPDPDALITSLEPIKANIIMLDAGKTKLTSAAIPAIAGFLNLEELRLQETATTDEDVAQLAPLRKLAKINLNGTEVTDRSVDFLTKFPNLVQLAAWDTTVSPVAADSFIKARFPETKKQRVQEEIAALEAQLAAMKVEVLGIEIPDQPPPPMVDGELYWAPVAASASSEFGADWAVTKLFDGGVKLADIGTPNNQGADYAGRGAGPHVVVYDMGSPITTTGLLFAQRAHAEDKAAQLEIRVTNADPGAAANEMPILKSAPDQVVKLNPSAANDRTLTKYQFGKELKGRYFVFKISGSARNTGGYELVLGKFPTSREGLVANIAANPDKYGTLIGPKAKASISSDTDYTPADGLVKLLDPIINEIPFAFHTKDEKHPWVKVVFPSKVRLSAMSIVNRRELQERADGLVLQRLGQAGEWETIWKSDQPREVWNVDLTSLDEDQREGTEFRFYITSDTVTALHLANIALWGHEIPAPATTPEAPKPKKKP
ncbi:MAG: hypothetical protein RL630_873, partial [Verrucomicrobiota bacterium]